jgi:hypothetical protein
MGRSWWKTDIKVQFLCRYQAIRRSSRFNWTFPIAISPFNNKMIYAGSNYVVRTVDGGQTWNVISPDLTRHDPKTLKTSGGPITLDNTGAEVYAEVFALAITNGLPESTYNRCVREDPNKKGILYCGTETGIDISFDDGGHWQSLQLNLPNTPVHDIQIQSREKDLVMATHGCSFWVVDDITPLYQLDHYPPELMCNCKN